MGEETAGDVQLEGEVVPEEQGQHEAHSGDERVQREEGGRGSGQFVEENGEGDAVTGEKDGTILGYL